jgi:hypothetical protein
VQALVQKPLLNYTPRRFKPLNVGHETFFEVDERTCASQIIHHSITAALANSHRTVYDHDLIDRSMLDWHTP